MSAHPASFGIAPSALRRTYMSIRAFNGSFFSYTVTKAGPPAFTVTGTLAAVTGANSTNCPAGRTLRENGKKLFPSANPGVSTYMVGVYDANSGLSGFIDPNDSVFTVYNTDKPVFLDDGVSATNNTTVDKAPGVYAVGDIVTTAGNVIAGGQIRSSTVTALTSITANGAASGQNINSSLGQVFTLTASPPSGVANITLTLTNPTAGARVTLVVSATTVQNTTITFAGTTKTGTLVVTAAAGPATQYYSISFVSDGTTFYETGRTAAQT